MDGKTAAVKMAVRTDEGEVEEEAEPVACPSQQQQQEEHRQATVLTRSSSSVLELQQQQDNVKEDDDDDDEGDEEEEKGANGKHALRSSSSSSSEHNGPSVSSSSSSSLRRFLSPHDLDSIRAFLVEQHVFGSLARSGSLSFSFPTPSSLSTSPASLTASFETDPGRSLFQNLALPCPEKLLHLYKVLIYFLLRASLSSTRSPTLPPSLHFLSPTRRTAS